MASSLLDVVRKQIAMNDTPMPLAGVPAYDSGARLGRMIDAAAGRTSTGDAPTAIGNQQERVAAADTAADMSGVAATAQQTANQQTLGAKQVGEAERQSRVGTDAKRSQIADAASRKAAEILQNIAEGKAQLDMDTNRDTAEQLSFLMRQSNTAYISALQTEAEKRRITDASSFKENAYATEFGQTAQLFGDAQAFRQVQAMDADAFQKMLGTWDINTVIAAYKLEQQTKADQAPYTIFKAAGSGALGVAASAKKPDADKKSTTAPATSPATASPQPPAIGSSNASAGGWSGGDSGSFGSGSGNGGFTTA